MIIDRNMAQSEAKFRQALLASCATRVDIEIPEAMVNAQGDRLVESYGLPSWSSRASAWRCTCSTWL